MKLLNRIFKISAYLLCVFILLYCGLWFSVSIYIQKYINNDFADKIVGDKKILAIKFEHASVSGFPFEIAYKLSGFKEYNASKEVVYNRPVKIAFNLLKQQFYLEINGSKLLDDFKIDGNLLISTDFKYSEQFLDVIKNKRNFELVNFFDNFRICLSDTKIFHKNELLYDLTISDQFFVFKEKPYYTRSEDIENNLPKYGKITNKLRVAFYKNNAEFPVSLVNPLNYNVDDYKEIDYCFTYKSQQEEKLALSNFFKYAIIDGDFRLKHDLMSLGGDLNYASIYDKKRETNQFSINSKITGKFEKEYKDKLSKEMIFTLENLAELSLSEERTKLINRLKSNFQNFIPDFEKFGNLEVDVKANIEYNISDLSIKIDRLSLKNQLYEIFINHDTLLKNNKIQHIKGVIALKQYNNLLNIAMDYIKTILNNLDPKVQHIKADEKYRSMIIKTIKSTSNYPDTESTDIYFDINIGKNSEKFGSADMKTISQNFYSLFLKILAAESAANGIDVMKLIQKLKNGS
jgi:hypothetical protein